MAMKPFVGATGGYSTPNCSLEVKVVSYTESDELEIIGLRVLKILKNDPIQPYGVGAEFIYEREITGEENALEKSLILD